MITPTPPLPLELGWLDRENLVKGSQEYRDAKFSWLLQANEVGSSLHRAADWNLLHDIDTVQASNFLLNFGLLHTFQVIPEREGCKRQPRIYHGSLDEHFRTLAFENAAGCGVYFMVNQGDGKGRREKNVTGIRALFVDLDGAPLKPVLEAKRHPDIVVESSPNKYHAYWLVRGLPISEFSGYQSHLAKLFDGDPAVKDLPRVMRVPGFLHHKGAAFQSRVIHG